jgi:pyruvate-formate lyase
LLPELEEVAQNCGKRLFTKNTAACEAVRRCIRCDACPVLEGYGEGLALGRSSEPKPQ